MAIMNVQKVHMPSDFPSRVPNNKHYSYPV